MIYQRFKKLFGCFKKLFAGKPHNRVEKFLLRIPTWFFVSLIVLIFMRLILWVEGYDIESGENPLKLLFQNAEAIAIVAGVALYFKEIPERKARKHYEAWQVIDNAVGSPASYARKQALEDLCKDGVSLANICISHSNLDKISLVEADLSGASLTFCDLTATDLSSANLTGVCFIASDLSKTIFTKADISRANFTHAYVNQSEVFSTQQIKSAKNWKTATYDPEIRVLLGLDPQN